MAAFFLVMLVQTVGYLPLRLADIQSLCLLMLGLAIASSSGLTPRLRTALAGGLVAGLSVLFRQNYVIALAAIAAVWFLYALRFKSKAAFTAAFWFSVGASSCLLQLIWIYVHSGIPWFYEPRFMDVYAAATAQPFVELIAYSLPTEGAYAAHLVRPVSGLEFVATKFYHGFFKFYWTPSLGVAPLDYTPQQLDYSKWDLLRFQLVMLVLGIGSCATIFLRRPWLSILAITAFLSAIVGAYMSQVEYRYFLFSRLAYIVCIFSIVWIAMARLRKKLEEMSDAMES